jgi:signal transduction histidine kinase
MKDSEQNIEWLFINIRWLLLLAVASVIGLNVAVTESPYPVAALALLVVSSVANVMAMIIYLQNSWRPALQNLMLGHDILIAVGFIAISQDLRHQLLFISLVPIITVALRNSWAVSMLVTFGIVGSYWAITGVDAGLSSSSSIFEIVSRMFLPLTNGAVLIIAGLAVGQIGVRIKQSFVADPRAREKETSTERRMAHRRAHLIFGLASTLSATLNHERILEAALDISHAGIQGLLSDSSQLSQIGMILLFGVDESLYVAKAHGASPREETLRFPATRGILAQAIRNTDPVVTNEPAEDIELNQFSKMNECQQAIAVPLRAGYESYGLLVLGSSEPDLYTDDFKDLLTAICNQAVLALQNARLYENLMEDKDRLVTVEEDARKKLARNLHDGPTQTIAAIAMRLNYIRLLVTQGPDEAIQEIRQLEDLARRTTKEIRQMLFVLRPLILESQGLAAALEQLTQKIRETVSFGIHLDVDRSVDRLLDKDAKGAIFYIVEEATNNTRKHAHADNLSIRLFQRGMNVVAEVEDDGKGFDVAAMEANYASRGSLGIMNLRERATLVKGRTVINSAPGKGTRITVTVPANMPDAEEEALEQSEI